MIGKTLTIKELWNRTGKSVKVVLLVTVIMNCLIINSWGEDALSVIHERTSIRKFTSQPVEEGKVETLLRAAMAAATSRNIQPWRFWIVTDTNILQELAENLPNTHEPLSTAPLAIVVAGDTEAGYNNEEQMRNLKLDCSIASENLLLAAQSIGLGAVWMGIYPYNDRIVTLRNTLSLPDTMLPINIIAVGYPDEDPPPKDNWDPERITYLRGDTEPVEISEEIIIASDIIDVIHNRTSIRQYTDQVVEEDKVELLLRAAMAAPSDGNKQPWEYYVISDRQLLQQLASALPSAKMLDHARLAITVCGDTTISESWELDCSAAGANILLAVTAIELGAVWTGVHPYSSRVNAVQSLLGLPDHIIPLNMIAIGYPDDDPTPKNKWKPSNIYYPVNSDANSAIVTAVLTNIFPNCTINANTDARIYGTSASNQIFLAGGSKAELLNFPGQNSIQIQSSSDLFSVFRSGAVVTFQSSDGTVLKIPATKDVQTIFFNGEEGMVMQIHNNQVMLDNQIISTTPASIEGT